MQHLPVWKFIDRNFAQPVMLLYVLQSKDSSPGREGFCMAVTATEMEGSIGGGIMEHKFVDLARSLLNKESKTALLKKQVHRRSAEDRSGMICSGEQLNLVYRLEQHDRAEIRKLISAVELSIPASLKLSANGIECVYSALPKQFIEPGSNNWQYTTPVSDAPKLYIVGAGHCALALSKLMQSLGFQIYLFDDRPGLNTYEANNFVYAKQVLNNYQQLNELIVAGNHYVVLMTMGYRSDDVAFRALYQKQFAYFGVLGSANKIKTMFNQYRHEGVPEKYLKRVFAPVGIPIHSQTPEEIAVSIAAQIVQVKNSPK